MTPPNAAPPKVEPVSPPIKLPATPPNTAPVAVLRCVWVMPAHALREVAMAIKVKVLVKKDLLMVCSPLWVNSVTKVCHTKSLIFIPISKVILN